MVQTHDLDDEYWSQRYKNQETGWDIGTVSPPLKAYIDQLENKEISILIPGCGNAWEAAYLLEKGFSNITVIDISETLAARLRDRFTNSSVKIIYTDFFYHQGAYDLILEQTFFCAIAPGKRPDYALKMRDLLKPGGKLAGILFNCYFEIGPPYGGSLEAYRPLFSEHFSILYMHECYNSIPARKKRELFVLLKKSI